MNEKLINAVIEQLGHDDITDDELIGTLQDVVDHGAAGGFSGFTYYADTLEFFKENQRAIVELCHDYAEEFGDDVISLVSNFNCLNDDRETRDEIGRAIYGTPDDDDTAAPNALAWFALEEVARYVTDN